MLYFVKAESWQPEPAGSQVRGSAPWRSIRRCLGNGGVDLGGGEENYRPSRGPASSTHRLSGCRGRNVVRKSATT